MTEPKNSLIRQYTELLKTEQIEIKFSDDAIESMAEYCEKINQETEDIGARRLYTIMEVVLEEIMFDIQHYQNQEIQINKDWVETKLQTILENRD